MSILTDNPTTITTGAEWNSMVRMADKVSIYDVLNTIAEQCEDIGEKLQERQCVRAEHCVIAIGSRRWDGRRMLNLIIQAPNNDTTSSWDRFQIIEIELNGSKYKFSHYIHNQKQVNNSLNSRLFVDIFKIPMSIFEDIKEAIANG